MKEIVPDFDPKKQIQLSSISGKGFYVIQDSMYVKSRNIVYVLANWKVSLDFHLNWKEYKTLNSVEELRAVIAEWLYVPHSSMFEFSTEKELLEWAAKI